MRVGVRCHPEEANVTRHGTKLPDRNKRTQAATGPANDLARTAADSRVRAMDATLPIIPVIDCGTGFALATLDADIARAHRLLDGPTRYVPSAVLKALDVASRRWLARWDNAYLPEIAAIAARLNRPGVYFFSIMYEWACTCAVKPSPDGDSAHLVRVLDWRTPGLGREVMAARVAGPAGPYVTLTWPGFSGVIQAMAPGRFSAALNQAPMRFAAGLYPVDWVMARRRLWNAPHPTAAHVLRRAFETCATFDDAKRFLETAPIALPAIYSLAGVNPNETCVIERTETAARTFAGEAIAANHWCSNEPTPYDWRGHSRGIDSQGRANLMRKLNADLTPDFSWATFPVMNPHTRLVMVADARAGRLVAQGFEHGRQIVAEPATQVLDLTEVRDLAA